MTKAFFSKGIEARYEADTLRPKLPTVAGKPWVWSTAADYAEVQTGSNYRKNGYRTVTERHQRIAMLRSQGLTLAAIGKQCGVSAERIRQILAAVAKKG